MGERKPGPERMGRAFGEYVTRYPTDQLPKAGGLNATLIVTVSLDALLGGLKAAHLDTGQTISAALARRLACEAGIIPAILDGQSRVLDLGRQERFHSHAQRVVATLEQHGCTAEGCDSPPGMCHLHHPIPWSQGGGTDRDALMLCPKHHRTAHDPAYSDGQAPRREGRLQPANLSRPPPHRPRAVGTVATRPPRTQLCPERRGFETVAARPPQPPAARRTRRH